VFRRIVPSLILRQVEAAPSTEANKVYLVNLSVVCGHCELTGPVLWSVDEQASQIWNARPVPVGAQAGRQGVIS